MKDIEELLYDYEWLLNRVLVYINNCIKQEKCTIEINELTKSPTLVIELSDLDLSKSLSLSEYSLEEKNLALYYSPNKDENKLYVSSLYRECVLSILEKNSNSLHLFFNSFDIGYYNAVKKLLKDFITKESQKLIDDLEKEIYINNILKLCRTGR